jgi:hypothetical protein
VEAVDGPGQLRKRAYDDPVGRVRRQPVERGGEQDERLARPGRSLDQGVVAVGDPGAHSGQHLGLAVAHRRARAERRADEPAEVDPARPSEGAEIRDPGSRWLAERRLADAADRRADHRADVDRVEHGDWWWR